MILLIAVDRNWAIGYDGDMLFHIKDDLKNFKRLTTHQIVVMGRKTFDSLPGNKPLPDRLNIVMTRGEMAEQEGLRVAHSVDELHRILDEANADGKRRVFNIGGGNIARLLWDDVDEVILTVLDATYDKADAWIPNLDEDPSFELEEQLEAGTYEGHAWFIRRYQRVKGVKDGAEK